MKMKRVLLKSLWLIKAFSFARKKLAHFVISISLKLITKI